MCTQWVKVKFLNSDLRPLRNCICFRDSIGIEREVLIRSEFIKSFDGIDQFDTEIIRNGLTLSKTRYLNRKIWGDKSHFGGDTLIVK